MWEEIKSRIVSRKFWMAVVGALTPIALETMSGSIDAATAVYASTTVIVSYILGQAYQDGQAALNSGS